MNQGTKILLIAVLTIFLAVITVDCAGQQVTSTMAANEPNLKRTVVLSGLREPWDIAFTPDGAMLFTEKCRGLSVRLPNGMVKRLYGATGSAVVAPDFFCQGQSGMLGVAVDPNFADNHFIYIFMTSNLNDRKTNRVVRLVLDAGYTTVNSRKDIITDIPYKSSTTLWGGAGAHSGGRIRFSPFDRLLYVTTGDNHNGSVISGSYPVGGQSVAGRSRR